MPHSSRVNHQESVPEPIPFPLGTQPGSRAAGVHPNSSHGNDFFAEGDDILASFATVSRRINDLARELRCLGYFNEDDSDRPRAA